MRANYSANESKQAAMNYLDDINDDADFMKPILSLAFPSRILLFKIMRASVGIKKVNDLWMFIDGRTPKDTLKTPKFK